MAKGEASMERCTGMKLDQVTVGICFFGSGSTLRGDTSTPFRTSTILELNTPALPLSLLKEKR